MSDPIAVHPAREVIAGALRADEHESEMVASRILTALFVRGYRVVRQTRVEGLGAVVSGLHVDVHHRTSYCDDHPRCAPVFVDTPEED